MGRVIQLGFFISLTVQRYPLFLERLTLPDLNVDKLWVWVSCETEDVGLMRVVFEAVWIKRDW